MTLSIIIISYNTKTLTCQCLDSLLAAFKQLPDLGKQSEIFVVDNNSTDGSVAALKKYAQKHAFINLLENTSNVGFAQANNQAIAKSSGTFVLLLNSDTEVFPETLPALLTPLTQYETDPTTAQSKRYDTPVNRIGIVAAHLLNPDHTPQPQGGSLPSLWSLAWHMSMFDDVPVLRAFSSSTQYTGKNAKPLDQNKTFVPVGWVAATAVLIRRQVFEEIGPLDPNIFMYGEDIEFCMRARDHHWDIGISPQAHVLHYGSASSTSEKALMGELTGYLYIWAKHKPFWQHALAHWLIKTGARARILLFGTILRKPELAKVYQKVVQQL